MNRIWSRLALTGAAAIAAAGLVGTASADDDAPKDGDKAKVAQKKKELEALSKEQFNAADRNHDGVLRGDEIPKGWEQRFDRDGDGDVSRTEFLEVNSRPPKLRRLHPMRDARARAEEMLRFFDRDKNGTVQREEYPGRDDVFRGADRNRNGTLEPTELRALAEEEIDDIRKKMRSPGKYDFLSIFDADKDGQVDGDEYDGPPAAFRKYDTDGDGVVTYYEIYPERMRMAKDEESKRGEPEKSTVIQSLDKDEDGKVSREEFPGNDTAWRRLDKNGDGWITAADGR